MVDFTPAPAERQRPLQLARPRAVILDEVDRLGDVAVRLRPRLARLEDDPGRQLVASLAQQRGHPTEDLGPRLRAGVAPGLERARGRRHCLIELGSTCGDSPSAKPRRRNDSFDVFSSSRRTRYAIPGISSPNGM